MNIFQKIRERRRATQIAINGISLGRALRIMEPRRCPGRKIGMVERIKAYSKRKKLRKFYGV